MVVVSEYLRIFSMPTSDGFFHIDLSKPLQALVALINPQMPRVHGDGIIHFSHFDAVVHHDGPLWIHKTKDGFGGGKSDASHQQGYWMFGPENPHKP